LASIVLLVPELARSTVAPFIVVDPFENIPIFMSLTNKMSEPQKETLSARSRSSG